jgi:hypothetical protein
MVHATVVSAVAFVAIAAIANNLTLAWDQAPAQRAGNVVTYRLEPHSNEPLENRFTPAQLEILEKLNRADLTSLKRLEVLVVPTAWLGERHYSPFPWSYSGGADRSRLLIVDLSWQAFGAYESGRLVRWGPISSGAERSPTPKGLYHLTWRSRGRYSTVNPQWFMKWYFNFDNRQGLSFHRYALPGLPASHGCIRLLERDAAWVYDWGRGWTLGTDGDLLAPGTPVLIVGSYAFQAAPPWRSETLLRHGIDPGVMAMPD